MADQDVTKFAFAQLVVEFDDGAAGIPENELHALFLQTFNNGL